MAAARLACGRSAGPVELQLEYKSAGSEMDGAPAGEDGPGEAAQNEPLPKFLTRGGDPDEQVCWAAPQLWARTPPWAPGNAIEDPECASLFLAEDLMRQGLLSEAEKALRFTKNWLQVSRMVFDKEEREDAARREYHEREVREREREKARCKALGLPDPDEVWKARVEAGLAQFAEWDRRRSNNNATTTQQQEKTGEQGQEVGQDIPKTPPVPHSPSPPQRC